MPQKNSTITTDDLLALIGRQVIYQQQLCEIVELLDGCQYVLQALDQQSNIQATQYGEGHRTVPKTYIVSVYDSEGELHADFLAAGLQALLP